MDAKFEGSFPQGALPNTQPTETQQPTVLEECIAGTGGPFPENYWDPAGITSKKSEEDGERSPEVVGALVVPLLFVFVLVLV